MKRFSALGAGAALAVALLGAAPVADAAGAMAVGKCDRVGWSYDYGSMDEAETRALADCRANGDATCEVVIKIERACGAFAVAGDCGARGWAWSGTREAAESLALAECASHGGGACSIHGWACDGG